MKILLVGDIPTHPVRMGNSRLIVDQAVQLREMGHDVHYLYVSNRPIRDIAMRKEDSHLTDMRNFWGEKLHIIHISLLTKLRFNLRNKLKSVYNNGFIKADNLYSSKVHKEINKLDAEFDFDTCIVNYYYLSKALTKIHIPIRALLTHDIFTYRHIVTGSNNIGSLTPNEEAKVMQRAEHILCVQEEDAIYFSKIAPKSKVYTTFTSVKFTDTPITHNHNILYLSGNSKLNIEGLEWFVNDILPKITQRFPDARLIIGGGICNALRHFENHPYIQLVGYVETARDFFCLGDISINPTKNGTGLKIKTMEALSYNKITMVHPHSAIGLYNGMDSPIFISSDQDGWVNYLEEIWNSTNDKIDEVRLKNKKYIAELNEHITNEYSRLLGRIK